MKPEISLDAWIKRDRTFIRHQLNLARESVRPLWVEVAYGFGVALATWIILKYS